MQSIASVPAAPRSLSAPAALFIEKCIQLLNIIMIIKKQDHISLPEIGDYTVPEIFDNKKNRTPEKCSKSFGNAVSAIFP